MFDFFIFIFMKVKHIPQESPTLVDFKYIICFPSNPLVFKKMNCFWTQLTEFVFFAHPNILSKYTGVYVATK